MAEYIFRRLLESVIVIIIVTFLVFIVMRLLPGDPVLIYVTRAQMDSASEEQIQALRSEYGLDKPIVVQYVNWLANAAQGNLGNSINYHLTVNTMLGNSLPITVYLGILALLVSAFFGIITGVISAVRRGGPWDNTITPLAILGLCVPPFWLGIMLIFVFGLYLGWLPIYGFTSPFQDFGQSLKQLIMPVFCLAIFTLAGTTRQTRSAMLEVVRQDYIRTAWSKGLNERQVIFRHALKNSLIPVVTLWGNSIRNIFSGTVLVESVFNIPGMGRMMVQAINGRDYAVIQAAILIIAIVVTLGNLTVDISYGWLDPRIRVGKRND